MMYGLESSSDAESQGRVILCGRPIDCQTLWYHGYPAMSLAKGVGWKEADAEKLANIPDIFVVLPTGVDEEEDLREAFKNSKLRDRVKLVRMGGEAPNPSELHKQDPNGFRERMDALIEGASALIDEVERERIAAAAQALEQCCELARQQSIPNSFVASIRARGVVGEERLCQLLFLALVSRLLKRPISIAVKGPSSGGKSFVLEQILRYFPSSAYFTLSAMSEHYLAYTEESFVHRHLVLLEATGMNKDMVSYLIRSLLSEGCIRYATLEKTSEGIRERLLVHEGPTGLMVTTTLPSLHPENETRMISATVTDTQDQTRAVFHAIADETADDDAQELEQWHALQRWLELAGRRQVTIPFAHILAELIPAVAVRLRRDFSSLLNLIRAHALLHQATCELDERGRIVATIKDYVAVRSLVADLIADEVGATVSKATREAVAAVRDLQGYGREGASNRQVAQLLSIDTSSALRRLRVAAKKGYVRNLETRRGAQAKWVPGDVMPEDEDLLPSPETLEACMVAPPTEGLEYPPLRPAMVLKLGRSKRDAGCLSCR